MKKWILLVSILLACFLVLCSCSDAFDFGNINIYETEEVEHNSKADTIDAGTVHKHLFVESDRKAPTCTADGYVKSVCSCGEEVVQAIAALGHNYVEHDGKEPGCEENGWVAYKTCSRCDLSTYREIPALGHDLVEIAAQAPACTEIGWEAYVYCTNCNYTTYAAIPATGHTKDEAVSENEVEPTCTEKGSYDSVVYCADCGEELSREEVEVDALGHNFVDPEEGDYFLMSCCDRCGAYGARRETEGNYDEYFVYDYDEEDYAALKAAYAALLAEIEANTLDDGQNPPEFVKDSEDYAANKAFEQNYYDAYIAEFEKVIAQYQICYLFYNYYDGEDGWEELYITLSDLYDEEFAHYYELYGLVYNTVFRNYFFSAEDGWTEEAIAQTLAQSAAESNPEMIELNKRVSEITIEYRALYDLYGEKVAELYAEMIAINNRIAKIAGYDNYLAYAYANDYGRTYSPEDVSAMRAYVKEYLSPYFIYLLYAQYLYEPYDEEIDDYPEWCYLFSAGADESIFDSGLATDLAAAYLKTVGTIGEREMSVYETVNDVFRNNNYFLGAYDAAYTSRLSGYSIPYMYFGPGYYSTPLTFIHEFGHYTNFVYNGGADVSMDLCEVHSQGNEMLFLSFLMQYLPYVYEDGDEAAYFLAVDKMADAMIYIILATAVDEFEYICYTGNYGGEDEDILAIVEDGVVSADEMDDLFDLLLYEYGTYGMLNSAYWRFVTIEHAGYYISYSISLLPSVEIFVKSLEEGLEETIEVYKLLICFTDDEECAYTDEAGNITPLIGFVETLEYAGLTSPFDEELYIEISQFFYELLGEDFIAYIDSIF